MKSKKLRAGEGRVTNQEVRRDIQIFLRALESYEDCVSRSPGVTFEQHRSTIESAKAPSRRTSIAR